MNTKMTMRPDDFLSEQPPPGMVRIDDFIEKLRGHVADYKAAFADMPERLARNGFSQDVCDECAKALEETFAEMDARVADAIAKLERRKLQS